MAVLPVLRMGNPLLLKKASEITEFGTAELEALIQDMLDTMRAEQGAGLAAPQIGVSRRLVVFGFDENARYPDVEPVPATILLNPSIRAMDNQIEDGWEGCLSVPGLRGLVPRFKNIEYSGFDPDGQPIRVRASGFHARVVQHECDHLDGLLYTHRMQDPGSLGFIEELVASGRLQSQPCDS